MRNFLLFELRFEPKISPKSRRRHPVARSLRDFYEVKRKKAYTWLLGVSTSEPKTYYFGPLGIIYKGKLVTL